MRLSALSVVLLVACGGPTDPNGGTGGGDNSGMGGGGTVDTSNHTVDTASLPCDVVAALSRNCASCHGSPATQGAHVSILSASDLQAPMPDDMALTVGEASMYRMQSMGQSVMPPPGGTPATANDILAISAYVGAGMLPGSCTGMPTMPAPTTCPSNSMWMYGNAGSPIMNPGRACINCHTSLAPREKFAFAGTVFTDLHTKDLCSGAPPAGGQVQLIGADGQTLTLGTSAAGNFYTFSTLQMPYTAKVIFNGKQRMMTTPQVEGDCNTCHTEQGISNAPGRIIWPE
jgi:mono/diheme cytochrome c family protein